MLNSPLKNPYFSGWVQSGQLCNRASGAPSQIDNHGQIRGFSLIWQPHGQYEQIHSANPGKKQPCLRISPAPGRAKAKQGTQQYPQIESGNVDDVALL
jgi:hypothetical protein